MSDKSLELINLIRQGKTCNEITSILNISNKQLFTYLTNLRNKGIMFLRKYYADGEIVYVPVNTNKSRENSLISSSCDILTKERTTELRLLAISDLHFGNNNERLDLIKKVYDYASKKDINLILCGGDIIDGTYSADLQTIPNVYEQIDYFLHNMPFDKNILVLGVGGDHDFSAFSKVQIDFLECLKSYRHDLIFPDYGNSFFNIKNDQIQMFHHLQNCSLKKSDSNLVFHGHKHKYIIDTTGEKVHVNIPPLCDITEFFPSFLEINLEFSCGYIKNLIISQVAFLEKPVVLNETRIDLLKNRKIEVGSIALEENFDTRTGDKVLVKQLSQIEKFNQRYGLK